MHRPILGSAARVGANALALRARLGARRSQSESPASAGEAGGCAAATVAAMSSCAVRGADEAGFVERRREVDAAVEHGVEEAVEALACRSPSPRRSSAAARRRRRSRTCRLRSRPPSARRRPALPRPGRRRGRACAPRARRRSRAWRSRATSPGRRRSRPGCPRACRPDRPARAARAAPSPRACRRMRPAACRRRSPCRTRSGRARSRGSPPRRGSARRRGRRESRSSPRRTRAARRAARAQLAQPLHERHAGAHEVHVAGDRLDHHAGDAACRAAANASSSAARWLYSRTSVSRTTASGTPALVGWPKVARPEPALTSSASAWPW